MGKLVASIGFKVGEEKLSRVVFGLKTPDFSPAFVGNNRLGYNRCEFTKLLLAVGCENQTVLVNKTVNYLKAAGRAALACGSKNLLSLGSRSRKP
jgi:hypothetical protein